MFTNSHQNFKLFELDNYPKPFQIPYLKVVLSNSKVAIIQTTDDWKSLKTICELESVHITNIFIVFMSNSYEFPIESANGYFFKMGFCGTYPPENSESLYFIIGYIQGNCIVSEAWMVPSITFYKNNVRPIDKKSPDYSLIIWKNPESANNNAKGDFYGESSNRRANYQCSPAS